MNKAIHVYSFKASSPHCYKGTFVTKFLSPRLLLALLFNGVICQIVNCHFVIKLYLLICLLILVVELFHILLFGIYLFLVHDSNMMQSAFLLRRIAWLRGHQINIKKKEKAHVMDKLCAIVSSDNF